MKTIWAIFSASLFCTLLACSPVKLPVSNQYQLSAYCAKPWAKHPGRYNLAVSIPEAASAYQTTQMLYMDKPFELGAFAYNAWISPPAAMLYPLLIKSLQCSGFFNAVSSSAYSEAPDFRLDTHLLSLEQNFLCKPSKIIFSAKIVLTDVQANQILASEIINKEVPCPSDNPEGGVIAANKAMELFTADVNDMVISHIIHCG